MRHVVKLSSTARSAWAIVGSFPFKKVLKPTLRHGRLLTIELALAAYRPVKIDHLG